MSLVGDILALYNNICQKTTFVKNVIHKFLCVGQQGHYCCCLSVEIIFI